MPISNLRYQFLAPDSTIGGESFLACTRFLRAARKTAVGWHYVVDLTWIFDQAKTWRPGSRILDVGGGAGPTQFLLAEMGMDVVNVDLNPARSNLFAAKRYNAAELTLASANRNDYVEHLQRNFSHRAVSVNRAIRVMAEAAPVSWARNLIRTTSLDRWRREYGFDRHRIGSLQLVRGDATQLTGIPDNHFDAVVSLSSIEHIPLERLPALLDEVDRVLRPDGKIALTTSATDRAETWFHEPSKGHCFSVDALQQLFGAAGEPGADAAAAMSSYRDCNYLRDHLAPFYFSSGENGMPWGVWQPQYFPVALFR